MGLREEIAPYEDRYGLIQNTAGGSSGNGLLYTAEYYITLHKLGLLRLYDIKKFETIINSCMLNMGLLSRTPDDKSQEGPDDYVGICAAAYLLKITSVSTDIYLYGNVTFWNYNNVNPKQYNFHSWFGRQPQLVTHIKFAAGVKPNVFEKLWWCSSILLSAYTAGNSQDSWILSWMLVEVAKDQSKLCNFVGKIWRKKLFKQWPGGIGQVLERYFGFQHPLAKYFVT